MIGSPALTTPCPCIFLLIALIFLLIFIFILEADVIVDNGGKDFLAKSATTFMNGPANLPNRVSGNYPD